MIFSSVADPDPPDPCVFRPPGSGFGTSSLWYGSGSFCHQAKIVRKTLIPNTLGLLFDFLSLKTDVNIPSKSNKKKTFYLN
jgi:hypothetical protein